MNKNLAAYFLLQIKKKTFLAGWCTKALPHWMRREIFVLLSPSHGHATNTTAKVVQEASGSDSWTSSTGTSLFQLPFRCVSHLTRLWPFTFRRKRTLSVSIQKGHSFCLRMNAIATTISILTLWEVHNVIFFPPLVLKWPKKDFVMKIGYDWTLCFTICVVTLFRINERFLCLHLHFLWRSKKLKIFLRGSYKTPEQVGRELLKDFLDVLTLPCRGWTQWVSSWIESI